MRNAIVSHIRIVLGTILTSAVFVALALLVAPPSLNGTAAGTGAPTSVRLTAPQQGQSSWPQTITEDLLWVYPQARQVLRDAGADYLTHLDDNLGALVVARPSVVTLRYDIWAVYFPSTPLGIVMLAPQFGRHDPTYEPNWGLWLAAILVHETVHHQQYITGTLTGKSCTDEQEAVQRSVLFLDTLALRRPDLRWDARHYRYRALSTYQSYCDKERNP